MNLVFESRVAAPPADVFAFHEDPANLVTLMAGWPGFRLLHHDARVGSGTEVWFEQTVLRCIPIALGFQHTEFRPPHRFAERLIHGPFSRFDHSHEFEALSEGSLVRDVLDVHLPLHYGGETMVRRAVSPALHRAFAFRRAALDRLFKLTDQ